MRRSVRHTARARTDLLDIWDYYDELGASGAGDKLLRKIAHTLDTLSALPESAPARREMRQGMRSFSVGRYIVFFDYTETELRLIRVVHGSRDITPDFFYDD